MTLKMIDKVKRLLYNTNMKYIVLTQQDIIEHKKDMFFYLTVRDLTIEDQKIYLTHDGEHKVIVTYSRDKLPLVQQKLSVSKNTWREVRALFTVERVIMDKFIQFIDVEIWRKVSDILVKNIAQWQSRNTYAAIWCYMYCGCRAHLQFSPGIEQIVTDMGGDKSRLCKKLQDLCDWGLLLKLNTRRFNCDGAQNNGYLLPKEYMTYIFKNPC